MCVIQTYLEIIYLNVTQSKLKDDDDNDNY